MVRLFVKMLTAQKLREIEQSTPNFQFSDKSPQKATKIPIIVKMADSKYKDRRYPDPENISSYT